VNMVNLLEGLYIATALAFVGAAVQLIRKRSQAARTLLWAGGVGMLLCAVMYWYLTPRA
jgi:hypothetical protein